MAAIAALSRGQNPVIPRVCLRVVPHLLQSRDSLFNFLVPKSLRPRRPVVLPYLALHGCAPVPFAPDNDSDVGP
jgi:hypothetical protein